MEERKLTDEEIVKALECCIEGDCTVHGSEKSCKICPLEGIGIGDGICTVVLRKKALELIYRLQTALDTNQCIIRLLDQDVADRDRQLESKVEAVYADFMEDYKIMRDELKECYDEFGKEQVETEKVIAEQKAEIERLTEENEYLDGCAKQFLADYQKCEIERNELQEQVDELKAKNSHLDSENTRLICEMDRMLDEGWDIMDEEADGWYKKGCKDTAKEILPEMLARAKRLKEQFDSTTYGTNREHLIATIEIEIEGIKNLAKRYGVEVE